MEFLRAVALIPIYLLLFLCCGLLFPEKTHRRSICALLLLGFMVYFSAFQLVAFPMKYLCLSLRTLTIVWGALLLALFVFILLRRRAGLLGAVRGMGKACCSDRSLFLFAVLCLGFALLLGLNINHVSDYDVGYNIGIASSSLQSGTIERVNVNNGLALSSPHYFYLLNTYTVHIAVMCRLFSIHPLVEQKFTMTIVLTLLFLCVLYLGGRMFTKALPDLAELAPKPLRKHGRFPAYLFTALSVLILMFSYSIAGVSHYFAYRTYEGKSVCAYLYMSAILVFFLGIVLKQRMTWGWLGIFFACLSGIAFCNTALFAVPIAASAVLLPFALEERNIRVFIKYMAVMIPAGIWAVIYYIT